MNSHASPPLLKRRLVGTNEVFRLILEFDVGVAYQAERAAAGAMEAGKHPVEKQPDEVIQHYKTDCSAVGGMSVRSLWRRQPNEVRDLRGQRQQGADATMVFVTTQL